MVRQSPPRKEVNVATDGTARDENTGQKGGAKRERSVTEEAGQCVDSSDRDDEEPTTRGASAKKARRDRGKNIKDSEALYEKRKEFVVALLNGEGAGGARLRRQNLLPGQSSKAYVDDDILVLNREIVQAMFDGARAAGKTEAEDIKPSRGSCSKMLLLVKEQYGQRFQGTQLNDLLYRMENRKWYAGSARKRGEKGGKPAGNSLVRQVGLGGRNADLAPPETVFTEDFDLLIQDTGACGLIKNREGIMKPELEVADDVALESYRDHFSARQQTDRLSKQDVIAACKGWQAVRFYVTTNDVADVVTYGRLGLFTHSGLLDVYMSILTDQRLSVGSFNPFKCRLTLFAKHQLDLLNFHNASTEKIRDDVMRQHTHFTQVPDTIVFVWLVFAYFGECARGVTTAFKDNLRVNENNAVVDARMPVVLVCVHDRNGDPFQYVLHVSGTRVTWTNDAAYAIYLYVAYYFLFNLSTKGEGVTSATGKIQYPDSNALTIELLARKVMGIQGSLPRNTPKNQRAKSRQLSQRLGDGQTILAMNQEKNTALAGHVMELGEDL